MEGQVKKLFKGWIILVVVFCEEELVYVVKLIFFLEDDEVEFYDFEDMLRDEVFCSVVLELFFFYFEVNGGGGG